MEECTADEAEAQNFPNSFSNQSIRRRKQRKENKHVNKKERKNQAHTTHAKTRAMAKAGPPDPSWRAIATAKAVTVAE